MAEHSTLAKALAIFLFVALICNGAGFFLKRIGWLNESDYRTYWSTYCAAIGASAAAQRQCSSYTTASETAEAAPMLRKPIAASYRYVYEMTPAERPLKLVKDGFWLLLIGCFAFLRVRNQSWVPTFARARPVYLISAYSMTSLAISIPVNGVLIAATGLRSLMLLVVPLCGRWLVPHLPLFATCAAAMLLLQAALVPLEMVRGIHLFPHSGLGSMAGRVAGTLAQPNSMGVFAVAAATFYFCFSAAGRAWAALMTIALALVFFSGSGSGWVCAAAVLIVVSWQPACKRFGSARVRIAWLLALCLMLLLLPTITGRPDLYSSLLSGARATALHAALFDRSPAQVAFGSGLGVNTNLAINLAGEKSGMLPTDSAFTGLLVQIGIAGTVLFYAVLAWAAARDVRARPFYAVIALCSLAINVTELFPVNVLFGLALAHSVWVEDLSGAAAHG